MTDTDLDNLKKWAELRAKHGEVKAKLVLELLAENQEFRKAITAVFAMGPQFRKQDDQH